MEGILFKCHLYMNKVAFITFIIFGIVLYSCVEFNGSGYSKLSNEEKEHVKSCDLPLDSIVNDGNLYMVDTKKVLECLQSKRRVILYEYLPFCSGNSGIHPQIVKNVCNKKHIDLIVISSTYDGILPILDNVNFPIYVIDKKQYKTDNYQVYSEQFYSTLTNCDSANRKSCSYHLFEKGEYINSYQEIEDVTYSL